MTATTGNPNKNHTPMSSTIQVVGATGQVVGATEQFDAFNSLAKKLVNVPKPEVDELRARSRPA